MAPPIPPLPNIPFTLLDLLDILLVAYLVYQAYRLVNGTRAVNLVRGIAIFVVVWLLAQLLGLAALSMVLGQLGTVGFFALVVLFQPELRGALDGRRTNVGNTVRAWAVDLGQEPERAAAIFLALTRAEVYLELVESWHWTPQAYEDWLAGALQAQLLRPENPGR